MCVVIKYKHICSGHGAGSNRMATTCLWGSSSTVLTIDDIHGHFARRLKVLSAEPVHHNLRVKL